MIDLSNLIFNPASSVDATINKKDDDDSFTALEFKEDQSSTDNLIAPGAFVLLFAELLSNSHIQQNPRSEVEKPGTDPAQIVSETNGEAACDVVSAAELSSNPQLQPSKNLSLQNNVALAWIDSESFEAPYPVSEEVDSKFLADLTASQIDGVADSGVINPELLSNTRRNAKDVSLQIGTMDIKEELVQRLQFLTMATTMTTSKNTHSTVDQENNIDGSLIDNEQYNIQTHGIGARGSENNSYNTQSKMLEISVPLNHSQWADKFSEHIVWLGHQGIKTALIRIHPEDLGPLEIGIKVVKDSASVTINSHNSHVRDIVDQALPRLREMLADQGLTLSEVHIGADPQSRQYAQHKNESEREVIQKEHVEDDVHLSTFSKRPPKGLIDYFA